MLGKKNHGLRDKNNKYSNSRVVRNKISEQTITSPPLQVKWSVPKAFDKVSHNLRTHKLNYDGIQGKTNTWIHNFLTNRTQAVLLEG